MRTLLSVTCGFVLTLAVFASGVAAAAWFLAAEPVQQSRASADATDLWTREPRKVDTAQQALERVAARPPLPGSVGSPEAPPRADGSPNQVDPTTTGALIPTNALEQQEQAPDPVSAAHLEWCASRYRSYDPGDNSYRPYSGGRRTCISPYLEVAPPSPGGESEVMEATAISDMDHAVSTGPDIQVTSEHAAYCFSRYRSYRPEDNTYQPYGGGPRRQCR